MLRSAETGGFLTVNALGFKAGGRSILKPVTMMLPLSGRTIVLGPNGAGKSTLLQLLHGMLPLHQGSIGICRPGEAERPVGDNELGFVLQRPVMLTRSVLGNVTHALAVRGVASAEREARAQRALARVGLAEFGARSARRLSGGEQQRLALAGSWQRIPHVFCWTSRPRISTQAPPRRLSDFSETGRLRVLDSS